MGFAAPSAAQAGIGGNKVFWSLGVGPQWVVAGWQPMDEDTLVGTSEAEPARLQGLGAVADGMLIIPIHKRAGVGLELVHSWNTVQQHGGGQTAEDFQKLRALDAMATFMFSTPHAFKFDRKIHYHHTFLCLGPSFSYGSMVESAVEGSEDESGRLTGFAARWGSTSSFGLLTFRGSPILFGAAAFGRVYSMEREPKATTMLGDAAWTLGLDVTFGLKHGGPKPTLKPSARRRKKGKRGR
jgi:hypothetical protein